MCRLMLFNRAFAQEHTEHEIADVFTRLNTIQGGHGMGVFLGGEKPLIKKALKVKGKDLAQIVYKSLYSKNPLEYCIFHCRLAGPAGSICDDNSQPYYDKEYDIALAHNGVASEMCNSKYDYSDTELLLRILCDYGIPIRNLEYYSGVFIGLNQGVPFVVKGAEWTDLHLLYNEDTGAWCFMSVPLYPLTKKPYKVVRIKRCVWQGHEVERLYLDALIDKQNLSYNVHYQHYRNGKWVNDDDEYDTQSSSLIRQEKIGTMTDAQWTEYDLNEWEKALAEEEREEEEKKKCDRVTFDQAKKYLETGNIEGLRE